MLEVPNDVLDDKDDDQLEKGVTDDSREEIKETTPESYGQYLTAQALLPQGKAIMATVCWPEA